MPPSELAPAASRITASTTYLFEQMHYALRTRSEAALKKHGVTAIQYTVLSVLSHRDGLSSADLSRRFYVTPQSMGQMLSVLADRGLLMRKEDAANRRILRVSLSPEGRDLVKACDIDMHALEAKAFASLEPAQLESLRMHLHGLIQDLRGHPPKKEKAA